MIDPRSILLVGKPAYYWSYLAPVAQEFHRRFGEPVRAMALKGSFADHPKLVQQGRLWPFPTRIALAFDIWSMIASRAFARTVFYVHHSLVGKGLVFRGDEPFRPFAFADTLCLPLAEHAGDMPVRMGEKIRITGHLPFDWLRLQAPLHRWKEMLQRWGSGGQQRVAVLCTHGDFGSVHLLDDIARLPLDNMELGVKLHGYLDRRRLPANMRDFGDCPTALIVQQSDLVITDHSTAAMEAHLLGVPCICYRSGALAQLQHRHPTLSELRYLGDVSMYRTIAELTALLKEMQRPHAISARQRAVATAPGCSASAQILDLCAEVAV